MAVTWQRRAWKGAVLLMLTTGLGAGGVMASASAAPTAARLDAVPAAKRDAVATAGLPAARQVGAAPHLPTGADVTGDLSGATPLAVDVALDPRNPAALAAYAQSVSTPGAADYHHYLSVAAFRRQFAPTDADLHTVRSALEAQGLGPGTVSASGLEIHLSADAAALGGAFDTGFSAVRLADGRTAYANTSAPRFSAAVASLVQGVVGLNDLSVPQADDVSLPTRRGTGTRRNPAVTSSTPHARTALERANATGGIGTLTSPCTNATLTAAEAPSQGYSAYSATEIADAYGFSGLYSSGDYGAGQSVAVVELAPYNSADIAAYQACYGTGASVTNTYVDGASDAVTSDDYGDEDPAPGLVGEYADDVEPALDIEQIIGLAPQAAVDVYEAPNTNDGLLQDFQAIVDANTAKTVSISWGICEPDVGDLDGGASMTAAENTVFEQAAIEGISVYAASGDEGAEGCDGDETPASATLQVSDPASQPYVTGVGGTTLSSLGDLSAQTTWNDSGEASGAGGGGISAIWSAPTYQTGAAASLGVMAAAAGDAQPCGAASCREVPDVSADADPYTAYLFYTSYYGPEGSRSQSWVDGNWDGIGGTSAAAPLWAALNALADASTFCAGTDIGFANPVLYAVAGTDYASAFTDVTVGTNDYAPAGNLDGLYPARPGYDLATGLGTPDAAVLVPAMCATRLGESVSGQIAGGTSGSNSGASRTATTTTPTATTPATPTTTPTKAPGPVAGTPTSGAGTGTGPAKTTTTGTKTASPCTARVEMLRRGVVTLALSSRRRSGSYSLTVSLPRGCSHETLSFARHVSTTQSRHAAAIDRLALEVLSATSRRRIRTLSTVSNHNAEAGYQSASVSLVRYAGDRFILCFSATGSGRHSTRFSLRTLALTVS